MERSLESFIREAEDRAIDPDTAAKLEAEYARLKETKGERWGKVELDDLDLHFNRVNRRADAFSTEAELYSEGVLDA
jgi:hypothetical protein